MKASDFLKILKIFGIGLVEFVIMVFMYIPLVLFFEIFAGKLNLHLLLFSNFYQNPYTLVFTLILYLIIGIILFILFKLVEIKLISRHKKHSYLYMLFPFILIILWEIIYNVINIYSGNSLTLIWFPLYMIIFALNLFYEFIFVEKIKKHTI